MVEYDERGGRPKSTRTEVNFAAVADLVQNDIRNASRIFRRCSRFGDGREMVEYDERGGRPKLTRTEVNFAPVADLVKK
jgi:hypothetical protein